MLPVLLVLLLSLVFSLIAWTVAREMNLSRWAALAAAGATLVAVCALGMTILSYLTSSVTSMTQPSQPRAAPTAEPSNTADNDLLTPLIAHIELREYQ
jgi:hypothetical protein